MNVREGFQQPKAAAPAPAPAQPPPPEPKEVWPMIVKLEHRDLFDPSKPDPIKELRLRQPTGGDINAVGNPIYMGEGGRFLIDDRRMYLMIGRLAGILTPLLDPIDPRDLQTASYRLFRFFIPNAAAWD